MVQVVANLARVDFPKGSISSTNKKPILDETVNWLRNNNLDHSDQRDTTVLALANLAGMPVPRNTLTPETKQNALDDVASWLRNSKPDVKNLDDPTVRALASVAGVTVPVSKIGPKEKPAVVDKSLDWLRNDDPTPAADLDEPSLVADQSRWLAFAVELTDSDCEAGMCGRGR